MDEQSEWRLMKEEMNSGSGRVKKETNNLLTEKQTNKKTSKRFNDRFYILTAVQDSSE